MSNVGRGSQEIVIHFDVVICAFDNPVSHSDVRAVHFVRFIVDDKFSQLPTKRTPLRAFL